MTFLGTLKGVTSLGNSYSHANAINGHGQVVGDSFAPVPDPNNSNAPEAPQIHAFLWTNLNAAFAINDRGQIVGFGTKPNGRQEAFLLTPTRDCGMSSGQR